MKAGWRLKPLMDVCQKVTDGSHYSPATLDGGFPYVTVRDIEGGEIDFSGCKSIGEADFADLKKNGCAPIQGDVLFSKDGTVGKVALVQTDRDFVVLSSLAILRPDQELIVPQYLAYAMQDPSFLAEAVGRKTGVAIRRVVLKNLKSIEIPLPSLEEQRRIVAVLDEAFAAIATATANAEKNLANARELFRSELTSVIDAGGDGWCELELGAFCEMYQPQTIGKSDMIEDGAYPVFGANGIIGKYDRFNHAEPQLLVTCRGATCGSLNISAPNSWITGNAMVVRPKDGALRLRLLMRIFEGAFDFSKVITGAAQPQITRKSFSPAKVKFPSNLDEQAQLEMKFDHLQAATDAIADTYIAKKSALSNLKQSLLAKAFSGEMTEAVAETIAA